ncbi:hypothetical protein BDY19DRAFT_997777 [Irpex rosettiformis]|uniref:Uncharacterized protein n=1 Tax=Irpex rosettiformis TaxID=378272 RepID=A0ACB8TR16_9APHY|nr:hypothetical protein BDY19DRAFT_997777 [Irpex rosettiformis]
MYHYCPYLIILGVVVGTEEQLVEGARAFKVEAQSHICGQTRTSVIKCVLEGDSPRWRNMRTPASGSSVHVVGTCHHVCADGGLAITVCEITFNISAPATFPPAPGLTNDSTDSPSPKRRQFNAVAPRDTPSSRAGPSASLSTVGPSGSSSHLPAAPSITPAVEEIDDLSPVLSPASAVGNATSADSTQGRTRSRKGKEKASD